MTKKTVIRVKKQPGQFATIHKAFLSDERLGLDAMGLLAWLLSKPDDWTPHVGHIATATGSAYGRVRSSMKRLEECGYVRRSPVRDRRSGRIIRWDITVFETPAAAQQAEDEQPTLFEKIEPKNNGRKKAEQEGKPRFQRDTPFAKKPGGGEPENGYPLDGNPFSGNRHLLRTTERSNELTKQQRTNPEPAMGELGVDRLPASAGGCLGAVATSEPSEPARAGDDCGTVVVDSVEKLVSSLVEEAYFPVPEARSLIDRHSAGACAVALECLRGTRKRPANARGFIVQAIKGRWEPARIAPSPVPRGTAEPLRVSEKEQAAMRELAYMDAALAQLSDADWARHFEDLRPSLGATILRLISEGRPPKAINSLRTMVYERLKRSNAA